MPRSSTWNWNVTHRMLLAQGCHHPKPPVGVEWLSAKPGLEFGADPALGNSGRGSTELVFKPRPVRMKAPEYGGRDRTRTCDLLRVNNSGFFYPLYLLLWLSTTWGVCFRSADIL